MMIILGDLVHCRGWRFETVIPSMRPKPPEPQPALTLNQAPDLTLACHEGFPVFLDWSLQHTQSSARSSGAPSPAGDGAGASLQYEMPQGLLQYEADPKHTQPYPISAVPLSPSLT